MAHETEVADAARRETEADDPTTAAALEAQLEVAYEEAVPGHRLERAFGRVPRADSKGAARHVQGVRRLQLVAPVPSRSRRAREKAVNCLDIEPMSKTEDGEIATECSRLAIPYPRA